MRFAVQTLAGLALGVAALGVGTNATAASNGNGNGNGVCQALEDPPRQNIQPLLFCNWYGSQSCCLPAHDADVHDKFLTLIEAGPACAKYQNVAKRYLSFAFCYACDPAQPTHFSTPVDTVFFSASVKTAKICAGVAVNMAPRLFADCGLTVPDDRESMCSPNSPVVPHKFWPDCQDGQYVCQSATASDWYCSDSQCGGDTPTGFADAPCNASRHTCDGVLMFLNDNRAAKPPGFEDFAVEIVDERQCRLEHEDDVTRCSCMADPSTAARVSDPRWLFSIALCVMLVLLHS